MFNVLRLIENLDRIQTARYEEANEPYYGNVHTDGDNTVIELPVPSVKPEDVDINIQDNLMKVTWKRETRLGKGTNYATFRVSDEANQDAVSAVVENGMLTITVPKSPKALPRQIKVLDPKSATQDLQIKSINDS